MKYSDSSDLKKIYEGFKKFQNKVPVAHPQLKKKLHFNIK